jgi:hypothetical protein
MLSTDRKRMHNRKTIVLVCSFGLLLTALGPHAVAGDSAHTLVNEGSTPTHRTQVDENGGQVYIYAGGSFVAGTHMAELQYIFDFTEAGNTTGYITPLLFERSSVGSYTIYAVVGISKGFEVPPLCHCCAFRHRGFFKAPSKQPGVDDFLRIADDLPRFAADRQEIRRLFLS